jgi:hypothetical protein
MQIVVPFWDFWMRRLRLRQEISRFPVRVPWLPLQAREEVMCFVASARYLLNALSRQALTRAPLPRDLARFIQPLPWRTQTGWSCLQACTSAHTFRVTRRSAAVSRMMN